MLVLSRQIGESIWIGPDIKVTVTEIGHGKVRIGIECPREIEVDRDEVRRDKLRNRRPKDST